MAEFKSKINSLSKEELKESLYHLIDDIDNLPGRIFPQPLSVYGDEYDHDQSEDIHAEVCPQCEEIHIVFEPDLEDNDYYKCRECSKISYLCINCTKCEYGCASELWRCPLHKFRDLAVCKYCGKHHPMCDQHTCMKKAAEIKKMFGGGSEKLIMGYLKF